MKQARFWVMALLLVLASIPMVAQEQTASIQGVVADGSGAALPGVTVEATSSRGGRSFTTQSDNTGHYRFPSLPPGVYNLTATLSGMQSATAKNVDAKLGSAPKVDLTLRMAAVTESVTVTADAPLVDVTSSAAQTSVRAEAIERLPRGRDFSTVVVQAPSANQNSKSGGISIDGATGAENRYIMDGVDTTNPQTGVQGKTLVTEFVEEVQVKSAGYQAEFGGSTGGVINVVTKTGTNDFRGSVGTFYQTSEWTGADAIVDQSTRTFQRNPTLLLNTTNTGFEQNNASTDDVTTLEPSFTLGGPLVRDNVWFYAGYQPWMQKVHRDTNFSTGVTGHFDQDFKRNNWLGTLSGTLGSKFLYKGSFNNSGYKTTNLLPAATGRGSSNPVLYAPDDVLENWTGSGYADFIATPQWFLSAKGGRFYRNYHQSGISNDVFVTFVTGPTTTIFPTFPVDQIRATGFTNVPTNTASQKDAYTRDNLNLDASWFGNMGGTHRVKGGIQFDNIKNEVLRGQQNYRVDASWNQVCAQCVGRGTYGSAGVYLFQTTGNVEENITGLFLQDSWTTMNDRLTLNIGVRSESEKVPSYADAGVPTTGDYAINFDFQDKVAPRLGFSYDVFGNGRTKAFGSFGTYYDITKLEMPRGSFGGDKWIYWGFDIESPQWSTNFFNCQNVTNNQAVKPTCPGMVYRSSVDLRHPSNSADLPLVDPNLKPMENREFSLGFQQDLGATSAVGFRWVNKKLIRAIEDVGVHVVGADGSEAEEFFIANPGFGVAQKILAAFGCTTCPAMPKAKRDYQGYEFEYTKRYSNNWLLHASYLYSTLKGNYSGLANSDEITATPGFARTSPNVNRIFDSLFMLFDAKGNEVSGPLGGDRPHQLKAQAAYTFPFGTTVGLNQYYYSGTPTTTELRFQGAPIFPFGRNDLGRTPNLMQTDINLQHELRLGRFGVTLGAIVLNLLDAKKVTNIYPIMSATSIVIRDLSACGSGSVSVAACGPAANTLRIGPQTGSANNAVQAAAFFAGNVDWRRQFDRQVALGLVPDFRYQQANTYQEPREARVFVKLVF